MQFAGRLKSRNQNRIESRVKKNEDEPQVSLRAFSTYVGIYNPIILKDNKNSLQKEFLKYILQMKERNDNCKIRKCKRYDERERNRLFNKIANDRKLSMITLCFRDPSLDVAPHVTYCINQWPPSVVDVVTQ
jgi:hypothetical protein